MKDNKFRVLLAIFAFWAVLFLVTLRVKAPFLEGVDIAILFVGLAWLAYWTFSALRWVKKPEPQQPQQTNASEKEQQ